MSDKRFEDMTEPELKTTMNGLARAVIFACKAMGVEPPKFTLLVFNDPAVAQYVGNCNREDMVEAFREAAGRLERSEDVPRDRKD